MVALATKVQERRGRTTIVETSAVKSVQSLGGVGRFHRQLQEAARAIWKQLQISVGQIQLTTALAAWVVRHASWSLFRFQVNKDWKCTPFQMLKSHPYVGQIVYFGERVLARRPETVEATARHYSKWDDRWLQGTWLGKSSQSDEHIVLLQNEVRQFRCVRTPLCRW